jgi:hypothetical protein
MNTESHSVFDWDCGAEDGDDAFDRECRIEKLESEHKMAFGVVTW